MVSIDLLFLIKTRYLKFVKIDINCLIVIYKTKNYNRKNYVRNSAQKKLTSLLIYKRFIFESKENFTRI